MYLEGGSPLGCHRVLGGARVLPQAAWRLDDRPQLWADEVRIEVERLNLDAASFRQLSEHHLDADAVRDAVAGIVEDRGKMHNPVTGSGGMLIGTVADVGPRSTSGLLPGQRVASLVSLTLTPLRITDGLAEWSGRSEQVPTAGHAILFGRSIAAALPDDLDTALALAVLDVAGAAALAERLVAEARAVGGAPSLVVLGAAGKSGALTLAAARRAGAGRLVGLVRDEREAAALGASGLADEVAVVDVRDPLAVLEAVSGCGGPAQLCVVCVDAPGAEHGAVLATASGGTIVFFSMATSFSAAALGAEGLVADVRMLIGNGYAPGHARTALELVRSDAALRAMFAARLGERIDKHSAVVRTGEAVTG
jgi:L-erythro-3,5-diaminohexanoate dehydrogenase